VNTLTKSRVIINQPQCSDVMNPTAQRGAEHLLKRGNMGTQISQLVL